jgi:hypothetical protein
MAAGLAVAKWSMPGGELAMVPAAGVAFASVERTGEDTRGRIRDLWVLAEVGLAARYRTRPLWWQLVGVFAEVRASVGADVTGRCDDCYDPLRGRARRPSVVAGLTIGR